MGSSVYSNAKPTLPAYPSFLRVKRTRRYVQTFDDEAEKDSALKTAALRSNPQDNPAGLPFVPQGKKDPALHSNLPDNTAHPLHTTQRVRHPAVNRSTARGLL